MTRAEFDVLKFRFTCEKDPSTGEKLDEEFSAKHFVKVDKNFGLF